MATFLTLKLLLIAESLSVAVEVLLEEEHSPSSTPEDSRVRAITGRSVHVTKVTEGSVTPINTRIPIDVNSEPLALVCERT